MSKSDSHRKAQAKAAGKNGRTEIPLSRGRKLDAMTADKKRATEVERCGNLIEAARRLRDSGCPQKVLQVPQKDFGKAVDAMKQAGVKGIVKNMGGTKRKSV